MVSQPDRYRRRAFDLTNQATHSHPLPQPNQKQTQLIEEAEALTDRIATPGAVPCPEPEQPPPLPPRHERLRFFVYPSEMAQELKQQQQPQPHPAPPPTYGSVRPPKLPLLSPTSIFLPLTTPSLTPPPPPYRPGPLRPLQVTVERESPRYQYREVLFEALTPRGGGSQRSYGQPPSRSTGSSLSSSLHGCSASASTNFASAHSSLPSSVGASPMAGFRGLSIHGAVSPFPSPDQRMPPQQPQQQAYHVNGHGVGVGLSVAVGASSASSAASSNAATPLRCVRCDWLSIDRSIDWIAPPCLSVSRLTPHHRTPTANGPPPPPP